MHLRFLFSSVWTGLLLPSTSSYIFLNEYVLKSTMSNTAQLPSTDTQGSYLFSLTLSPFLFRVSPLYALPYSMKLIYALSIFFLSVGRQIVRLYTMSS